MTDRQIADELSDEDARGLEEPFFGGEPDETTQNDLKLAGSLEQEN